MCHRAGADPANPTTIRDYQVLSLKRSWRELKRGSPGKRFQQRAQRVRQRRREGTSWVVSFLAPTIGAILLLGGLALCLMPGPGLPLIFIGAALISERSLTAARVLDWAELKLRKAVAWGKSWWRNASPAARLAAVLIVTATFAAAGYGALRIGFGL